MSKSLKNILLVLLATVPLLLVLALGFKHDPHAVPSVLEGRPATNFRLTTTDGNVFELAAHRGRPVVINFWASWCAPCLYENPWLQQAAADYQQRVQFIGIIYQDTLANAQHHLAAHPSVYPQAIDPDSTVAIDFGVAGVPESFIIDANGLIVFKQAGLLTRETLAKQLKALL